MDKTKNHKSRGVFISFLATVFPGIEFFVCLKEGVTNIDRILCIWRGRIGEYHLNSEKLRFNMDRRPKAGGPY